jgi:putative DNA primase/helicase
VRNKLDTTSVLFDPRAPDGYVVHSHAGDDWPTCRDYVRGRLGLPRWYPSARCTRAGPVPPTRPAPSPSTIAHDDAAGRTRAALRIWSEAAPIAGTPAECYLVEHRKLDTKGLSLGHALRWHPGIRALVALMTDPLSSEPIGVHRTFFASDGSKLERKMLGRQGAIQLSPDDAVTMSLGLTEGIEDGLAVLHSGWRPVWSATCAGAIARFPVLPGVESLTVFADSDEPGLQAAETCRDRWLAAGREAVVAAPGRFA